MAKKYPGKGGILRHDSAKDNLEQPYHIQGDLREDVLTDKRDARGGLEEDDITNGEIINDDNQPEST